MKAGVSPSATNRQNLSYAYDAVDNVKSIVDGNNSNQRQCFHYDDRNRLDHAYTGTGGTGGCSSVDNSTGSSPLPYNQTFTYSPSGNFLTAAGRTYGYGATQLHAPKTVGSDSFVYNENGAEREVCRRHRRDLGIRPAQPPDERHPELRQLRVLLRA